MQYSLELQIWRKVKRKKTFKLFGSVNQLDSNDMEKGYAPL